MALDSAQSFVKRFYENDDFMKELYRMGAFTGGKANDPEASKVQSRKLAEVAPKLGYDFSVEEYDEANNAYIKNLGAWKSIKMMLHIAKVAKQAEKEMKKGK